MCETCKVESLFSYIMILYDDDDDDMCIYKYIIIIYSIDDTTPGPVCMYKTTRGCVLLNIDQRVVSGSVLFYSSI